MLTRSQCFLALVTGGALQLGCGSRTGTTEDPRLRSLSRSDAGVAAAIEVDPAIDVRSNDSVAAGSPANNGSTGTTPGSPNPAGPGAAAPGDIIPPAAPNPTAAPDPIAAPSATAPPSVPQAPSADTNGGAGPGTSIVGDAGPAPLPPSGVGGSGLGPNAPSSPPDARRSWLYVDDGEGLLTNVYDTRESFALPTVDPTSTLLMPWSNDGANLTLFQDTTLSFQDLVTGQQISSNDTGTQMQLFGWVEGYGALIGYYYEARPVLYLGDPQGGFVILGETPELSLATRATSSPAGNGFLYATDYDSSGYVYWVDLDSASRDPVQLVSASSSALSLASWSADGRWAAFDDGDGALWLLDTKDPSSLFELGASTSSVVFSPTGALAALWQTNSIELFDLSAATPPASTTLNGARSAARFSPDGTFLYYAENATRGVLQPSDAAGSAPLSIDGFAYDCPLVWTAPDRFVYQQCATRARALVEGVIGADAITTTQYNDRLLDNLAIGPEQRCFANWGGQQLDIGTTALPLVTEFTRSPQVDVTLATLSPHDFAVAWVEDNRDVYWLPLNDDCTVSSLPALVHSGGTVQTLTFVAEWP